MNNIYDLIIIGGGPAGITAGIYAGRQRMKTLLITKEFGGQIAKKTVDIENWPGSPKISGMQLIDNFVNHLKIQEVDIKMTKVQKIEKENNYFKITTSDKENFNSKSVIIATGADPRPLEVPGEKEFIGRGVSYCATCDGPVFKNKTIVIVGGGNSGFEVGLFMLSYANKIYILNSSDKPKADNENQSRLAKNDKIEVINNVSVKEIKGDNFVREIIYQDLISKEMKNLKIDGVFVEIGHQPATFFAKDLVDFNNKDEIIVNYETLETKTPGLFAVGDVNVGVNKQIVTAAGEGCKAALSTYKYIRKLDI